MCLEVRTPGPCTHLVRVARVVRVGLDRALQFAKAGKAVRPVGLKPWSVVLLHEILPTILEEVVFLMTIFQAPLSKNH